MTMVFFGAAPGRQCLQRLDGGRGWRSLVGSERTRAHAVAGEGNAEAAVDLRWRRRAAAVRRQSIEQVGNTVEKRPSTRPPARAAMNLAL